MGSLFLTNTSLGEHDDKTGLKEFSVVPTTSTTKIMVTSQPIELAPVESSEIGIKCAH